MEYICLYLFHAELSICKPNSQVDACQQKWNWAANCVLQIITASFWHGCDTSISRIYYWKIESCDFTHFKACLNSKEKNLWNILFNL